MGKSKAPEKIFFDDEMKLRKVKTSWTVEEMLQQDGIFYLKDVAKKLKISSLQLKKKAQKLINQNQNPWEIMGIQRVWTHWLLRMKVFAPYLKKSMIQVTPIGKDWDGNKLLSQPGTFLLADVCKYIPFTTNQIRYHAHRNAKSREEYGVWKDEYLNAFVVDMPIFADWIKSLWLGGFQAQTK